MNAAPKMLEGKPIPRARTSDEQDEKSAAPAPERKPTTAREVIDRWRAEGPIIHEPTGIEALDLALGGGPTYGSRGVCIGAPDAWKTGFIMAHVADVYSARGIVVGVHAVDEEDSDLVTRFMQRRSFRRDECEARTAEHIAMMQDAADSIGVYFYDNTWTIEEAAEDLFKRALGKRTAYFVDSIQTVTSNATKTAQQDVSERKAVTSNMLALRDVSKRYRHIGIATCEMNRGGYRSAEAAEQANDMATGAESRAIEFQARWMIALRSVKNEGDLVHVRIPKNKLGSAGNGGEFYLRVDRAKQQIAEAEYEPPEVHEGAPDTTDEDVIAVRKVILSKGVVHGADALRTAVRAARVRMSNLRVSVAVETMLASGELLDTGKPNRPKWSIRSAASEVNHAAQ